MLPACSARSRHWRAALQAPAMRRDGHRGRGGHYDQRLAAADRSGCPLFPVAAGRYGLRAAGLVLQVREVSRCFVRRREAVVRAVLRVLHPVQRLRAVPAVDPDAEVRRAGCLQACHLRDALPEHRAADRRVGLQDELLQVLHFQAVHSARRREVRVAPADVRRAVQPQAAGVGRRVPARARADARQVVVAELGEPPAVEAAPDEPPEAAGEQAARLEVAAARGGLPGAVVGRGAEAAQQRAVSAAAGRALPQAAQPALQALPSSRAGPAPE